MRAVFIFFNLCLLSFSGHAQPLTEDAKGRYFLGQAERGKTEKLLGIGNLQGKHVVAVTDCEKGCPMMMYQYQEKESQETGKTVYYGAGLYLIEYNADSFIVVMPNSKLGHKPWQAFQYANLYSKNAQTAKNINQSQIQTYAKQISAKLFNQAAGDMAHGNSNYFLAMPQAHLGKSQRQYQIIFNRDGQKQILVKPCDRCPEKTYTLLPEETAIIGTDVYRYASSDYLFDLKDGVLVYTFANASGLGKVEWGKNSHYNVYANNENYIRQLITSKQKQNAIDQTMATYFHQVKTTFEAQAKAKQQQAVANRTLPKADYQHTEEQKKALAASQRWASAWQWKETIKDAYFTSHNWSITRNPLTGVMTGRVIRGIVTMQHPDGRCRYQHSAYRQDYNGSDFVNLHMTGIGPIYDLKCEKI